MSAITQSTKISLRSIASSAALEPAVALLGALALALAFPKTQAAWLAPFGAAGLFWAWRRLSLKRAFFVGWFAGIVFFAINFSWFTYTVGAYVGSLAFAVVLIPAIVEGLAFALSALAFRAAAQYVAPYLTPLAFAAAFTVFEYLRSIGTAAVPFAQIGYSQTNTPFAVFAAYVGSFGITFIIMLLGAQLGRAVAIRRWTELGATIVIVAACWAGCYAAWPARFASPPHMRVAAVQGNVAQSVKWNPDTLPISVARYTELTQRLAPLHPQLVVWPETVITTDLDVSPSTAVNPRLRAQIPDDTTLSARFAALAHRLGTNLVVGSLDLHWGAEGLREYNALYTYAPSGVLADVYDKRQLVPFTESLPAPALFSWIPYSNLIGRFGHGAIAAVVPTGTMTFAPLICWESAFSDLVHAQLARGAQFLVISTDDAWFGRSSGTFQHAQIAQMRAIESGEWVLQSASTGISGIISPMGVWTQRAPMDRQALVTGSVGMPPGSLFARIGPAPIAYAAALLYVVILLSGLPRRKRNA